MLFFTQFIGRISMNISSSSRNFVLPIKSLCPSATNHSTALYNFQQVASFAKKISKSRNKRLPLTTKKVGKGYYKGNRSRKEGRLDSKGHFHRVREWCTELVVPDLTNCTLKPYVGSGAKRNLIETEVKL